MRGGYGKRKFFEIFVFPCQHVSLRKGAGDIRGKGWICGVIYNGMGGRLCCFYVYSCLYRWLVESMSVSENKVEQKEVPDS